MCCTLSAHPRPRKSPRCAPVQNAFVASLKLRACPIYSLTKASGPVQCIHGTPLDCLAQMDRGLCSWTVIIGKTEFWAGPNTQNIPQTANWNTSPGCKWKRSIELSWSFNPRDRFQVCDTSSGYKCAPSMCPPLNSPQLPGISQKCDSTFKWSPDSCNCCPKDISRSSILKVSRVYNFGSIGPQLSVYFKAAAWVSRFQ